MRVPTFSMGDGSASIFDGCYRGWYRVCFGRETKLVSWYTLQKAMREAGPEPDKNYDYSGWIDWCKRVAKIAFHADKK